MIREFIPAIAAGRSLSRADARRAMLVMISGEGDPSQIAELLTALKAKGETLDELAGFIQAMREKMVPVASSRAPLVDLCGTGGDRKNTFNISTTASFVVAAAGLAVAKHGNRSVSSKCGSADILEKLGAKIDLGPAEAGKCLDETGYAFMFAPRFHPAMKHVALVRRALGVPTVFNILGPLCNPAGVRRQLIGVYEPAKKQLIAAVLKELGHESALVVHSRDGLDEISPVQPTDGVLLLNDAVSPLEIIPGKLGIRSASLDGLNVADADESIRLMRSVFGGERSIARDAVLINAAGALYIGGAADSMETGFSMAAEAVDRGKARQKLEAFIEVSNRL